jgi:Fe-S cluster assembly protein SufD
MENKPGKQTEPQLEAFERLEREAGHPGWVFPLRKAGMARFAELGFPTLKDEDWRFTNVAPIAKLPFRPVLAPSGNAEKPGTVSGLAFGRLPSHRLVFVDGHFAEELSSVGKLPRGVIVSSVSRALAGDASLLEKHLGRYAQTDNNAFAALNSAFFQDGGLVFVPGGVAVEQPIHLLFIACTRESGATTNPRNLIIAQDRSRVTVIESYVSTVDAQYFTNAVTELVLGEEAAAEHCKFQDESPSAFHVAAIHAHLGKACRFAAHSIATGARLSRNSIRTGLKGEGLEAVLNGLYVTKGDQLADHHMVVEHAEPHCASHEYYNGILDGRSKGVFHGRILVRPDAQKTDAKQTNKNLLLSDEATVDTKPQLEIYADDVKCTHGATVGQLNEESIFYLRARGIGVETARRMLIHAFAGEIIDRIRCVPVQQELNSLIWDRLENNPHIAGAR